MLVLLVWMAYLSTQRGQISLFDEWDHAVYALFSDVGGLQTGAPVELAGVTIGRVDAIDLVGSQARITMSLRRGLPLREDAQAEIKARGLIGERYVALSPGRTDVQLPPSGEIRHTEPPVNMQELLTQLFMGVREGNSAEDTAL